MRWEQQIIRLQREEGRVATRTHLMCQMRQMLCRQQIIMVAEALLIEGTPQRLLHHHYHQFLVLLLAWAPLLPRRRPTLQPVQPMLSRLHRPPLAPPPPLRSSQQQHSVAAFAWLDRNRRKFVTTAHGLEEGNPILRERWRQIGDDSNAPPQQVCIQIPQPLAVERYYEGAGTIDVSNKVRQNELMMDRRLQTNQWDYRVNFGILGIIFTDTWFLYQKTVAEPDECPNEFFSKLADEMIDNTEGVRPSRARVVSPTEMDTDDVVSNVVLRQTLRKRNGRGSTNADGSAKAGSGRCAGKGCTKFTSWVCGACTHPTDPEQRQTWYCRPVEGGTCTAWEEHKNCMHGDTLA